MKKINWYTRYRFQDDPEHANDYRWSLIGFGHHTGELWAHYAFATRPTRRQLSRTKRGKCTAIMVIQ
ncbi:TPA: hypothetical protein QH074_004312 [Enterobacter hormaechei subsp. steigerwaltii]|nr:hypothetical protein [Enterobacter hormaechei subsp. steigerwaltii]